MADADSDTQPLVSPPTSTKKDNPTKFYSHFLFKALISTLFLFLVPLQAPEFIDQSLFPRSWELLHLVFVGIAVSYGLFSRWNSEDSGGQASEKFNSARSYVTRLLHVSSVFREDFDGLSESSGLDHYDKVQTWSSRYHRKEPMVVVAEEGSPGNVRGDYSDSVLAEKPLLLPVRSLKSRVPHESEAELLHNGLPSTTASRSRDPATSSPISRESSNRSRYGGNLESHAVSDDYHFGYYDRGVLHARSISSPISDDFVESDRNRNLKSHVADANHISFVDGDAGNSRSSVSRSSSDASSVVRSNESWKRTEGELGVLHAEAREKTTEESVVLPSPIPWRSRPLRMEPKDDFEAYEPRRSLGSQTHLFSALESLWKSLEDEEDRDKEYIPSSPPPPPPPPQSLRKSPLPTSSSSFRDDQISNDMNSRRSDWREPKDYYQVAGEQFPGRGNTGISTKFKNLPDDKLMGKSVRSIGATETMGGGRENGTLIMEIRSKESRTTRKPDRNASDYLPFTETAYFLDEDDGKVGLNDYEVQSEADDERERILEGGYVAAKFVEDVSDGVTDEGKDVDKKADEFIARFREQIRLQRIESIKRRTLQLKRESSR